MHCSVSYQLTFCSVDLILPLIENLPVKKKQQQQRQKNEIKQSKHCSLLFIVNDSSSMKYKLTLRKGHLVVQLYLTFLLFLSLFRVFSTRFSFIRSLTSENSLHLDTRST